MAIPLLYKTFPNMKLTPYWGMINIAFISFTILHPTSIFQKIHPILYPSYLKNHLPNKSCLYHMSLIHIFAQNYHQLILQKKDLQNQETRICLILSVFKTCFKESITASSKFSEFSFRLSQSSIVS